MISRGGWGARAPKEPPQSIKWAGWGIHWEGTPMGQFLHTTCAGKVRSIQSFHMDTRKWNDIAYNFVVCPHGEVYEGRGWGVRSAANGTNEANASYLAVCYLGGEGDPFTEEAKKALAQLTAGKPRFPHKKFFNTACPGPEITKWIEQGCPVAAKPEPLVVEEDEDMAKYVDVAHGKGGGVGLTPDQGVHCFGAPFYGSPHNLPESAKIDLIEHGAPFIALVDPDDLAEGYIVFSGKGSAFKFDAALAADLRKQGRL